MRKNVLEVNFSRYLDLREEDIIRHLTIEHQNELELIHYYEKTRGIMYRNIDNNLGKRLLMLRTFVKNEDLRKIEEIIENAYDEVMLDSWNCEYSYNRIKIYANDFPCRVYWKKISSDIELLNKRISFNTAKMIRKVLSQNSLNWDSLFVWIKFYLPLKHFDIDNSYYKPIIDGIVRGGLIDNDDFTKISFGFNGCCDMENPHMEIYIYEKCNIDFCEIQQL